MRTEKSIILLAILNLVLWTVSPVPAVLQTHGQAAAVQRSMPSSQIAWSANGSRLAAVGGQDGNAILLWDAEHKLISTIKGHTGWVSGVAWSPDGKMLASAGSDKTVRLWSADGQLLQTISGHTGTVDSLMWSPDGTILASAAANDDGTIRLWTADGKPIRTIKGGPTHIDGGSHVLWSPTGKLLLVLYGDNKAQILTLEGNVIAALARKQGNFETGNINRITWSPDGEKIAAASVDQGIEIFSKEGTLLQSLPTGSSNGELDWSPDGKYVAAASFNHQFSLWNAVTGQKITTFDNNISYISSVAFSPDGSLVAFGAPDKVGTVHLVDMQGKQVAEMSVNQQIRGAITLAWSPDSKMLVGVMNGLGVLPLWGRDGKTVTTLVDPLMPPPQKAASLLLAANPDGHTDTITMVSWSPDATALATASLDRTVRLWDNSGKLLAKLPHPMPISALAWSPDGKSIATGGRDNILRLWSADGKLIQTFDGKTTRDFLVINWLNDGKTISATSWDNVVHLWDVASGNTISQLPAVGTMLGPQWSPDGKTLAIVTEDAKSHELQLQLRNDQGDVLLTIPQASASLNSMAWSPDSKTLAISDFDVLTLWTVDGKQIASIPSKVEAPIFRWTYLAWSPDGSRLAVGSVDQAPMNGSAGTQNSTEPPGGSVNVLVIDASGQQINKFTPGTSQQGMTLSWSPDGKMLAVAMSDDGIQVYSADGTPLSSIHPTKLPEGLPAPIWYLRWSPDSKLLAASSDYSSNVELWQPDGHLAATLAAPADLSNIVFLGVEWSVDSKHIAVKYENAVWLWDSSGKPLANFMAD